MTSPGPKGRDEWRTWPVNRPNTGWPAAAQPTTTGGEACDCGHDWERHGSEAGGCIECRCPRPAPSVTPDSDQLRDEIAGTLTVHDWVWSEIYDERRCACGVDAYKGMDVHHADALLPLVQSYADEQAAKALELVAVLTVPSQDTAEDVRQALFRYADEHRTRAAALDPNGDPQS